MTMIDTLRASEILTDAGLKEGQAKALIEALAFSKRGHLTKDYLDARLESLEQRIEAKIVALRSEITHLRSELKEAIAQATIKYGVMIAAALGLLLALQKALGL